MPSAAPIPPTSQIPQLQRIHRDKPDEIVQAIIDDGCCIIKGFTSPELIDQVNADTEPYLAADKPWKGDLFPPETRRCCRLVARSPTVRNIWLVDSLIDRLTRTFVDKTTHNYYGSTRHTYTSRAIVNTALTMSIGPGGKAQRLHRDDKNHHVDHIDQTKTGYRVGSDVLLACLIPGIDTSYENGATLAIPGSHLWGMDRIPTVDQAGYAVMQKGDAYVMLGGTYHAGGANQTADAHRPMHCIFFCRGYLRAEENVYLATSTQEVLSWSPQVQRLMGYEISSPNLGFIDFVPPNRYLAGDYDPDQPGDLDPSQEVRSSG